MYKLMQNHQETKKLVAVYYNFLQEALSELEIKYNAGVYFSFNFGCYTIKLNIFL